MNGNALSIWNRKKVPGARGATVLYCGGTVLNRRSSLLGAAASADLAGAAAPLPFSVRLETLNKQEDPS